MRAFAFVAALFACALGSAQAQTILFQTQSPAGAQLSLRDGRYGKIIEFQRALEAALGAGSLTPDGDFGGRTRAAITQLLARPEYADLRPHGPVITRELWTRLLPQSPPPSVHERAMALILTYEATPYDSAPEWNFCQSRPRAERRTTQPCLSNDPTSFLTWGPRGATAGGGREIQAVLVETDRIAPALIDNAFGARAAEIRRFVGLATANQEMERYLCAVWMDEARASAWGAGFAALGREAPVRAAYERIYAASNFDGGKMAAFYRLYAALGRTIITEADYGFFLDRATHTSGVFVRGQSPNPDANTAAAIDFIAARIRERVLNAETAQAWEIRRAISQVMPTSNQRADRNGRDVVFFVEVAGLANLTEEERANWQRRGARGASAVGLSDEPGRVAPALNPPGQFASRGAPTTLTTEERAACPLWVLNWTNPGNGATRNPVVVE